MEGKAIYSDALTNLMNVLQIYTCILQMSHSLELLFQSC